MSLNSELILSKINELQKEKDKSKFWNITYDQGIFLSNLASIRNAKNVLEIGTSNGYSTLWIAKGILDSSNITTIEVDLERFEMAKANFRFCDLRNINQLNGEVFEIFNTYEFENKFDFVFLDAAHKKYEDVINELVSKKLLEKDFAIVCDNILSHDYMSEFVSKMEKRFDTELVDIGSGFLIIRP